MTTPVAGFWESLSWTDPYTICSRETRDDPLPPGLSMTVYHPPSHPLSHIDATAVCHFLATHFGNPPHTPQFCLSPTTDLLTDDDYLYIVQRHRQADSQMVGSVRYRWIGTEASQGRRLYAVDAFCVHPEYRRTGVGRALLLRLHRDANQRGIPYAFFLKEGRPLSWWIRPVYTGYYAFCETATCLRHTYPTSIRSLPTPLAHRLLRIYAAIYPDVFILFPGHTRNQIWKQYQKGTHTILVCIQDTYQRKGVRRMGWVTAWLESSTVTDAHRARAAEEVAASVAETYEDLWMNREWVPRSETDSRIWHDDGGFQWYAFQWSVSIGGKSYCLLHG